MRIAEISGNVQPQQANKRKNNPTFGSAMPILGAAGVAMQWIENKGYFISFLIQDGLGMTLPRVITGFERDKNITGKYNTQEGLEVLGRESLTGPFIVGVAPITLALAGKFCKSTNTNTRLIKRFGESLKNMVKSPEFDATLKKDADKFKEEFYRKNLETIYKASVPNDKNAEETINNILKEFKVFDSAKGKERDTALANITKQINDKIAETSSNFYDVNKLYVGDGDKKQAFALKEALVALKDYGNDAIKNNKNLEGLDEAAAENIKNNFATKRLALNVGNIAVTLAGLSYLPKLYAKSDVSPGAAALEHARQQQQRQKEENNIAFKGKGINKDGILAKLGNFITKYVPEKAQALLEYTGYNFSKTTFALLATLGLIFPRGKRALECAQVDKNGKRDMTEVYEILLRDTVSSLSVVFTVPMLTKMIVKSYENKVGFVLTNKASEGKTPFKKFLDIINPYSDLEVLSVADLDSIYGDINNKKKLLNFADFVDAKGGDLEKIISKSENAGMIFNETTFTLDSIKNEAKEVKNKKIISILKGDISDEVISKVMKGSGEIKHNKIAKMARGFNSLPGFISTVVISPLFLGVLLPMLTYHITRKSNEKKMQQG